jgi:hypothetical protein
MCTDSTSISLQSPVRMYVRGRFRDTPEVCGFFFFCEHVQQDIPSMFSRPGWVRFLCVIDIMKINVYMYVSMSCGHLAVEVFIHNLPAQCVNQLKLKDLRRSHPVHMATAAVSTVTYQQRKSKINDLARSRSRN